MDNRDDIGFIKNWAAEKGLSPEPTPIKVADLKTEGISIAPAISAKEKLPPVQGRLSQATTMTDLLKDYGFFTPALMYKYLPLKRDPVADFAAEYKTEVQPFSYRFDKPIFRGLEVNHDQQWNHVLFGVEKTHWEKFMGFMGSLAFIHPANPKVFVRIRMQDLEIPDPMVMSKAAVLPEPLPMIPISAFVLDSMNGCYYFSKDGGIPNMLRPYKETFTKATFEDTVRMGQALFAGHPNPYAYAQAGEKNVN